MLLRSFIGVVVVSVLASYSVLLEAQSPSAGAAQPEWLLVNVVKLNPGVGTEYNDLQMKEVMPAQKKGGGLGRQAWGSGVSGPPRQLVYISPISSFAQFDKPNPMVTALGQEGATALNARVVKLAEPVQTMIVRRRPDLSHNSNPSMPSPLAIISIVEVVPGKRGEFEAFIKKDVLAAMQQAKAKSYSVLEVVYGDSTNAYITAVGYDTYEAIGKGHPFQVALGEDGARKLDMKVAGMISRVERFISRHRPELSWSAEPATK
jgi:hypothetical protein